MQGHKRAVVAGLALIGILAAAGCRRAETDYDPYTDFSAYTSFVWEASATHAESEMERDFPLLMQELRDAVDAALLAWGLQRGGAADAGLVMGAHLELAAYSEPASADMPARKLGPLVVAPYSVTQADDTTINRELQEGTIMLTATDRVEGRLVWQGWMRRVMDMDDVRHAEWAKSPDPEDVAYRHKLITRAVEKLLADFPPKGAITLSDEGRAP